MRWIRIMVWSGDRFIVPKKVEQINEWWIVNKS